MSGVRRKNKKKAKRESIAGLAFLLNRAEEKIGQFPESTRWTCFLLSALFLLFLLLTVPVWSAPAEQNEPVFAAWKTIFEGRDEAQYQLNVGGVFVDYGLEVRWYATGSGGNIRKDYAEFRLYNVQGELAGYFRCGRDGDNRDNVTGWHAVYLVLPRQSVLNQIKITLHQPGCSPRLITSFSWAKPWDAAVDINFSPLSSEGRVIYTGFDTLPKGKVWLHAVWPAWNRSAVDYVIYRRFTRPAPPAGFETRPDIYLDVSYAGTLNTVGEGWTGQGGYALAVQAGVGQGFSLNNAFVSGKKQCLWKAVSHTPEGFIMDVAQNMASGVVDIALDAAEATILGYIKFVLESAKLAATLDVDEKVAKAQTVIFENVPLQSSDRVHAWVRLKGVVAALGLAHSVASFYSDGWVEGNLNGNRGIELGGIMLHYQGPSTSQGPFAPEVTGTVPENGATNLPRRPELKVNFSQNIAVNNQANVVLHKAGSSEPIPCSLTVDSANNKTLIITPGQELEYNTSYELEIKPGAVKAQTPGGVTNLGSFIFRFSTGAPFMVINTSPEDGAANVKLKPKIIFTFNRPITGQGNAFNSIALKNTSGQMVAAIGQGVSWTISSSQLILTLANQLAAGQKYIWEIPVNALRDNLGNFNQPARLAFITAKPVQVIETSPRDKEIEVPIFKPINIYFSSSWIVSGPKYEGISLKTGNTVVAIRKEIETTTRGKVLVIRPVSSLNYNKTYVLTIPEEAVKDDSTEAPSLPYTLSFSTAIPPEIKSTTPENNASGVFRDQEIILIFSKLIKPGPALASLSLKDGGADVPFSTHFEGNCLILEHSTPFRANSRITVTVPAGAVVDLNGTENQTPLTISFTTGSGGTPPQIWSTSPADGEEGVALQPVIIVRFTKNIQSNYQPGQEPILLKTEDGQQVIKVQAVIKGNQLEIRPYEQLRKNTVYIVTLPAGCVKEELGSPFAGPVSFRFRTQFRSGPIQPK